MTARGRGWRGRAPPSVWARAARGATAAAGCHAGAAAGVVRSAALTPRAAARRREADMVDGGGVPRGVMGRRGKALSEDLQNSRHLEKNLPRDEEKVHLSVVIPWSASPRARARTSKRGASSPAARHRFRANVASDAARFRPSTKTSRRSPRRWSPSSTITCGPGSTSSSSCRCAPTPRRRFPRGPRARLHPLDASLARALARRADVPSHAAQCRFILVGAFSAPPCSFYARRTTNNAPPLPPLPSLPRASSTATRF
jgi:hypothetical protein